MCLNKTKNESNISIFTCVHSTRTYEKRATGKQPLYIICFVHCSTVRKKTIRTYKKNYNLLGNRISQSCTPFFKLAVTITLGSTGLYFADEKFGKFGQHDSVCLLGQGTASTVCSMKKCRENGRNI
jgi:hypothetical protein